MPDSPLEQLIAALQADDPGSLAGRVQLALAFARDHLLDAAEGAGSGAVDGAVDQVTHALAALELYRAQLEALAADLESIERDLTRIRSAASGLSEASRSDPCDNSLSGNAGRVSLITPLIVRSCCELCHW